MLNYTEEIPADFDQEKFINEAMRNGFELVKQFEQKKYVPHDMSVFLNAFYDFKNKVERRIFLSDYALFLSEQKKLFELIDSLCLSEQQKLFCEFLLGLCRFAISLSLYIEFSNFLLTRNQLSKIELSMHASSVSGLSETEPSSIWSYFHEIALLGKAHIEHLIQTTKNFESIGFWPNAKAFFDAYPIYEHLAKALVGMHFVPAQKRILGLAQTLHWGGFGGSGIFLEEFKLLSPLLAHRIGYHDRDGGGFNARLIVIFKQLENLKAYANSTALALLLDNVPCDVEIRILDVGSGPEFLAASEIIRKLKKRHRKVALTASEVDVSGIRALQKKQQEPDSPLKSVKYLDLNFIDEIDEGLIVFDEYEAVTARLVLHQLSIPDIQAALKFFIKVTKPGGYIFNPDVGEAGYYQALLVPANNVDREGFVPSLEEHSFKKTAVKYTDTTSKVALPLVDKARSFPSKEIPLYTFFSYRVVEVKNDDVSKLDKLWEMAQYDLAAELATTGTRAKL